MEIHTERLKLIPCSYDSLSIYATAEYDLDPHISGYLEDLKVSLLLRNIVEISHGITNSE